MASKIKAIGAYRPRIKLGQTVQMDRVVHYIAERTGLNESEIGMVLDELRDAVAFFCLDGLGTYTPKIGLDGTLDIAHLLDRKLKNRLNTPGAFKGQIKNQDMIGKTSDDLVVRWDEEHPDDRVT